MSRVFVCMRTHIRDGEGLPHVGAARYGEAPGLLGAALAAQAHRDQLGGHLKQQGRLTTC